MAAMTTRQVFPSDYEAVNKNGNHRMLHWEYEPPEWRNASALGDREPLWVQTAPRRRLVSDWEWVEERGSSDEGGGDHEYYGNEEYPYDAYA